MIEAAHWPLSPHKRQGTLAWKRWLIIWCCTAVCFPSLCVNYGVFFSLMHTHNELRSTTPEHSQFIFISLTPTSRSLFFLVFCKPDFWHFFVFPIIWVKHRNNNKPQVYDHFLMWHKSLFCHWSRMSTVLEVDILDIVRRMAGAISFLYMPEMLNWIGSLDVATLLQQHECQDHCQSSSSREQDNG